MVAFVVAGHINSYQLVDIVVASSASLLPEWDYVA